MATIGRLAARLPGRRAPPRERRPRAPGVIVGPVVLITAVLVLPVVYLFVRAAAGGIDAWALLARPRTALILARTLGLVGAVSVGAILIAVPVAWLTTRSDVPLRRVWAVVGALPLVLPSFVFGFVVSVALSPRGMLQQLLGGPFGVREIPSLFGFPGAALTLVLLSYPYVLLPVQSSLRRMDPALEDASRNLGNSALATFRKITLPMLRPAIAAGTLLVALYTLSDFGAVSLLRFETFTWAIFVQYESAFDRSIAAALSLVLVAVALFILVGESLTRGRARYHAPGPGSGRRVEIVRLGWKRWPAAAALAVLALAALVLPIAVLLVWLTRGIAAGVEFGNLWEPLRNSVYVSALAAFGAAVTSIPVAALLVRYPGRFAWLVERVSYIGFVLPGMAVAIGLVFFGVNFARPFYQTLGLLILAYVVLFFPTMLGAVRSALLQVNPRLEEAARVLGRTPIQTLLSVTLPLVKPGIFAGAALVFLLTMKELPATLILGPIGFTTLATETWSAASEAFFARAAAPALLTIVASSLPLAFLLLRGRSSEIAPPR